MSHTHAALYPVTSPPSTGDPLLFPTVLSSDPSWNKNCPSMEKPVLRLSRSFFLVSPFFLVFSLSRKCLSVSVIPPETLSEFKVRTSRPSAAPLAWPEASGQWSWPQRRRACYKSSPSRIQVSGSEGGAEATGVYGVVWTKVQSPMLGDRRGVSKDSRDSGMDSNAEGEEGGNDCGIVGVLSLMEFEFELGIGRC